MFFTVILFKHGYAALVHTAGFSKVRLRVRLRVRRRVRARVRLRVRAAALALTLA